MLDPMIEGLGRHGFEVLAATTGAAGIRLASSVDAMILDLGLPDLDGLEVCRQVRLISEVPIIIVTARGQESDRVRGLELGADDYVVKPFSMRELAARIRANVRRYVQRPPVLMLGELVVDRQGHTCTVRGEPVDLTPKEFTLLVVLAEDPGRVVTRSELYARVWDPVWVGSGKSLDVHVAALRRKLAGLISIEAVRGVGYRLEAV
jgi:DNA-binding response OmpR family regulator